MKRIKTLLPAAALAASAMLAGSAQAETVIFDHTFDGGTGNLNNTPEDFSGDSWVATPTNFLANGTIGGSDAGTATLAFTPADGFIYTLDASFTGITGDANWIPFGFVNGQGTSSKTGQPDENRFLEGQTVGVAWMFARGANSSDPNNAFLGDPAAGTAGVGNSDGANWTGGPTNGGDIDMRIVLDTTAGAGAWTATWFAKRPADSGYTTVRATADLLSKDITSVGFGESATQVSGTIESFSLTSVPEPSSLALLGLGGLLIARRRRSA